jgi:outer membrane protein OmpA-like peptidoglycan-associated protein
MIRVEGHADKRGDSDKNLTLSADRAEGVAALLQRLGVSDAQIETVAAGETKPIRDSRGNIQDERSRRVELMLLRSAPTQSWFTSQCDDE